MGLRRVDALLVAGLAALCPGVMYFATVAELHGVFLPFAALAWLAFAHLTHHRATASSRALLYRALIGFNP